MAILNNNAIYDIYEKLEYNFLYKSDLNSIHILLNLYDLDKNIKNICPKYSSRKNIREALSKSLGIRSSRLAKSITDIIHEDLNRLELYIYLEGYRAGYFDLYLANKLEGITVKNTLTERLYEKKYLYHHDLKIEEVKNMKKRLNYNIDKREDEAIILSITNDYYKEMIRARIYSLNKTSEFTYLDESDLSYIDNKVYGLVLKSMKTLYKESYWYGLNDRVLKRYR